MFKYLILILFIFELNAKEIILIPKNEKSADILVNTKLKAVLKLQEKSKKIPSLNREQKDQLNKIINSRIIDSQDPLFIELIKSGDFVIDENPRYKIESSYYPNDELLKDQYGVDLTKFPRIWSDSLNGEGIVIGVVDTGIDPFHEDLENSIWVNPGEDLNGNGRFDAWPSSLDSNGVFGDLNGIDDDNNGYTDDLIGYDFVQQYQANLGDFSDPDPFAFDEHGHGTNVSGIIAASGDNQKGITGAAYKAKIMTLRAFDAGGYAESDDIASAIVYAVLNGAKVLNFSFGEPYSSPLMHDAIKFAYSMGVFMSSSSGNENRFIPHYPSDYAEVVSVGGVDENSNKYGFGNYGSMVDILAPGVRILTTDAFTNDYVRKSGTSMAAPFVSAAAAVMMQKYQDLGPSEIRTILQLSAFDLEEAGWDYRTSTGMLDVAKAVNEFAYANFEINYPTTGNSFNKRKIDDINVDASIYLPLMDKWEAFIGEGLLPELLSGADNKFIAEQEGIDSARVGLLSDSVKHNYKWKLLATGTEQISSNEICKIDLGELKDTIHTFKIRVHLKNNSIIERRVYVDVINSLSSVEIEKYQSDEVVFNGRSASLLSIKTNVKARVRAKVFNTIDTLILADDNIGSEYQWLLVDHDQLDDGEYNIELNAYNDNGDTAKANYTLNIKSSAFPYSRFREKDYSIPMSYLSNNVFEDVQGNAHLMMNDLSDLIIDELRTYTFSEDSFQLGETVDELWIPIDIGDTDGDGVKEVLSSASLRAKLYESTDQKIFGNSLFETNFTDTYWGEGLHDFNQDGKDELILNDEYKYYLMRNNNGEFAFIGETELPEGLQNAGLERGAVYGNLDDDPEQELLVSNNRGMIFIYEYKNNELQLEHQIDQEIAFSRQFNTAIDIDGDGKKEFMNLSYGGVSVFGDQESNRQIWLARLFQFDGERYNVIWREYIYGVRDGAASRSVFFRNGVVAGDLDGEAGEELVISTFPDVYVYSWKNSEMQKMWTFPFAWANSALIYDFDKNGLNEIGFTVNGRTAFFELDKNDIGHPARLVGHALNSSEAKLNWEAISGATDYYIYLNGQNGNTLLDSTKENSIVLNGLNNNTFYTFFVIAMDRNSDPQRSTRFISQFDPVTVFTHNNIQAVNAEQENENIVVDFNGRIPGEWMPPELFMLENDQIEISPSSAHTTASSKAVLSFIDQVPSGTYTLKVASFNDYYKTPTIESHIPIEISYPEQEEELILESITLDYRSSLISLKFSKEVALGSDIPSNYQVSPNGYVFSVDTIPGDAHTVQMLLSNSVLYGRGKNYYIKVINVYSKDGKKITDGPGNTLGFVVNAEDLAQPYAFPAPFDLNKHEEMFFGNLTWRASVEVYNMSGRLLATIEERDGNGGVEWDLRDNNGDLLTPGVYLFRVTGQTPDGEVFESDLKKFMVIRN